MSNVAYQVQKKQVQPSQPAVVKQKKVKKRLPITLGERVIIWTVFAVVIFGSVNTITTHAMMFTVNRDIQNLEAQIEDQHKQNDDLLVEVKELSTYERIWAKARELGLTLNEDNVKLVQE